MTRRCAAVACAAAGGLLATAPAASAHGLSAPPDLPIPEWLFAWGAAALLLFSFVGLAVLWERPQLEPSRERRLASLPRGLDPLCGLAGIALFALVVYAGLHGTQTPPSNLTPTVVFVLFWVGLVPLSLVFGDVLAAFSPWRAVGRAVGWGVARLPEALHRHRPSYPAWLGRWPAAIGLLAFAWIELVDVNGSNPSRLATFALVYAAVQMAGMGAFGVDTWTRNGDAFGAYFAIVARIAPLRWTRSALFVRRPLAGLTDLDVGPGTIALFAVMIGTTAFDGFLSGPLWNQHIVNPLIGRFTDLGFSVEDAPQAARTVGLLLGPLFIGALYRLGILGMRWTSGPRRSHDPAVRFAHSLVPIAVAYVIAHYFSLVVIQGQATAYLVSDPLGDGSDLFGTAGKTIDYRWISAAAISYVQVVTLMIGHVAGLALAHDRALVDFPDPKAAMRSQYWMLSIMVVFSLFGLWLLFEVNA